MATSHALLIGQSHDLMMAVPPLLNRSGFTVDVISTSRLLRKTEDIANIYYVDHPADLIKTILAIYNDKYKLVVIGDDGLLKKILESDICPTIKLALLPVVAESYFGHLYSKIGLSQILRKNGVQTPDFRIAHNSEELLALSEDLGYPIIIKIDSSGAGSGVFECNSQIDVMQLCNRERDFPLLIQKKIVGDLLDLSGFYQNGQLVHFSYSTMDACVNHGYGPSFLRTYTQLANVDKKVFDQLQFLGSVLGIDGFANISAILSSTTKEMYFFEADLRPNVWVDYSKYIGDDPALAIKDYFEYGKTFSHPVKLKETHPEILLIPYFRRMGISTFIFNRYNVWNFTDGFKAKDIASYFLPRIINSYESLIIRFIKPYIPTSIWKKIVPPYNKAKVAIANLIY